jgi:hypothetical protein
MQKEVILNLKNSIYAITISSFIVIIIITLFNLYNSNSFIALIVSYSAIVSSLILMFGILYNKTELKLFNKLTLLFPFIVVIFIILFIIYLLVSYYEQIVNNRVSNYYYTFSLLTNLFLLTQLIILYNNIDFDMSKYITNKTFSILTLLGTINFVVLITMGIILKFFNTDG